VIPGGKAPLFRTITLPRKRLRRLRHTEVPTITHHSYPVPHYGRSRLQDPLLLPLRMYSLQHLKVAQARTQAAARARRNTFKWPPPRRISIRRTHNSRPAI